METTTAAPAPISVPAWAWLFVALAAIAVYAVTMDNGLLLAGSAETAHELFHDARHIIGAPCH
jgi:hypothetical protein